MKTRGLVLAIAIGLTGCGERPAPQPAPRMLANPAAQWNAAAWVNWGIDEGMRVRMVMTNRVGLAREDASLWVWVNGDGELREVMLGVDPTQHDRTNQWTALVALAVRLDVRLARGMVEEAERHPVMRLYRGTLQIDGWLVDVAGGNKLTLTPPISGTDRTSDR